MAVDAPRIAADWFDGLSARPQPVDVWLVDGRLHFGGQTASALAATWPERQRHGQRQILLPGGGMLAFANASAFDAWARAAGQGDSHVVRWQQSWRLVALSVVLLVAVLAAGWRWGLPWAIDTVVAWIPETSERPIGTQVLAQLDRDLLKPSRLSRPQQQVWEARFAAAIDAAVDRRAIEAPARYGLHFRAGGEALGPNAFALPGGDIVVTDELLTLLADEPDAVLTVLGHELGHVQQRHALRHALRAGAVGVVSSVVLGDFSSLLAAAPALLAGNAYARDYEREADAHARALARGAGLDASRMTVFFKRLAQRQRSVAEHPISVAFSTHPADAERVKFFSEP